MPDAVWGEPTSDDEMSRRASGRRWYNSVRAFCAQQRRRRLLSILVESNLVLHKHGTQARLARELSVSRSTVNRDLKRILADARERKACPVCQRPGVTGIF